ncbi:MAG: hypothetical protein ACTTI0_05025 [Treponema sp.]
MSNFYKGDAGGGECFLSDITGSPNGKLGTGRLIKKTSPCTIKCMQRLVYFKI